MPDEFIADEVIQKAIDTATFVVDHEKSSSATTADLEKTIEINASYMSLMAYASEIERSLGIIGPSLGSLITEYKLLAEKALKYIRRASRVKEPYYDTPYSLWEYAQALTGWFEDY